MGAQGLVFGYKESIYKLPPFRVTLTDATGAGDAFCAGIIKKIINLKGQSLKKSFCFQQHELRDIFLYGAAAGAASVTAAGTTTDVNEEYILSLIQAQGSLLHLVEQT
jgi:sugar/nucleoside kinase (ribokinase family)